MRRGQLARALETLREVEDPPYFAVESGRVKKLAETVLGLEVGVRIQEAKRKGIDLHPDAAMIHALPEDARRVRVSEELSPGLQAHFANIPQFHHIHPGMHNP